MSSTDWKCNGCGYLLHFGLLTEVYDFCDYFGSIYRWDISGEGVAGPRSNTYLTTLWESKSQLPSPGNTYQDNAWISIFRPSGTASSNPTLSPSWITRRKYRTQTCMTKAEWKKLSGSGNRLTKQLSQLRTATSCSKFPWLQQNRKIQRNKSSSISSSKPKPVLPVVSGTRHFRIHLVISRLSSRVHTADLTSLTISPQSYSFRVGSLSPPPCPILCISWRRKLRIRP